jgi:ABC-type nitrate/sulfonate/bicarbonate transport system substrate-binding protein
LLCQGQKVLRQIRPRRRNHSNQEQSSVGRLVAGELDFITGIGTAIEGIGKGMPVKAVAVLYRAPLFSLLSALPNPKSLEGKKISLSRIGSESHFNGAVMLENSGADPKKVTWIQTGSTALNMLPLERGLVEGAVLSPPFTGVMAHKGFRLSSEAATSSTHLLSTAGYDQRKNSKVS